MIVDDSSTFRTQLAKQLTEASFEVVQADNGAQGVRLWEEQGSSVNMIITDYNMPEMDGLVMLRKIRKMAHGEQVVALMLTTESTPELKELGKEVNLRAWVTKPYVPEKILAAVKKLLGAS
jgi:two-component system chemotaxis response regulator CheY